jgi:carboxyl-terminal processing protease
MSVSMRNGRPTVARTRMLAGAVMMFALGGCGGGNGGDDQLTSAGGGYAPYATLANQCAAPRTGLDPFTGLAYPDQQGSFSSEQNWLASWTNDLYLWYGEVPPVNPAGYSNILDYFNVLKTPNLTASGKKKDQFHFTYPTAAWEALSQAGAEVGYGATFTLVKTTVPRLAVVAYNQPGSPATTLSPALARGAQVLKVDGVDLVNDNTSAGVDTLNAGLFPANTGEAHQFVVLDVGSSTPRTITMTSANITSAPVQNVKTVAGGAVGYMLFNDHIATSEPALINAVAQLKAANVTDLVLDIRYNGGGYLDIASELAYMVAGPTATSGKTFELLRFNDKHPTVDPVAQQAIAPTPFYSAAAGFSTTPAGTALPYLGLSKVYVLTGPDTCSASEAVMNGLRGANVQVIQIGSTTCGKPYGFYPADNCGTTFFAIQFQGVNAQSFGDYSDGFAPQNGSTAGLAAGAVLPGCAVADDYTHALGDPAEARLAAALGYRSTGTCPTATGVTSRTLAAALSSTDGRVFKSPFLSNRILSNRRTFGR